MLRAQPILAAAGAAVAAWLTQGTIAFTQAGGSRVALLPADPRGLVLPAAAAASVLLLRRAGASLVPVWLLALLALPWSPLPAPAAFLIWSGPLSLLVWLAVALSMAATLPSIRLPRVRRQGIVATALAGAFFLFAAWHTAPWRPGGDEPHYLVITQSLLADGDLRVENNYARGDHTAYYRGELRPHFGRRGRDGEHYSVHAPGLPALVAPAFAAGGYPAVVIFLALLMAAGCGLAWNVARTVSGRDDAAWFAWGSVTLATTTVFHSVAVYPDGPGAVIAAAGVWALLRAAGEHERSSVWPWVAIGAALALMPWLHSRFALIAGAFGVVIALRLAMAPRAVRNVLAFLSVPTVGAAAWIGFFVAVYGRFDPSAPYGRSSLGAFGNIPVGLAGLLFDQRFGLLAYAPVLACAGAGLIMMVARRGPAVREGDERADTRRLGLELAAVIVPYLMTVTYFTMWWGGWSAPARFFMPVLLTLAVPAAIFWVRLRSEAMRAVAVAALVLTAFASISLVVVEHGRLAYNVRQEYSLWFGWLAPLADIERGIPIWFPDRVAPFLRDTAIWVALAGGVLLAVRRIEASTLGSRGYRALVTAGALAVASMAGLTIVWSLSDARPPKLLDAQLHLLRQAGRLVHSAGLQLWPVLWHPPAELVSRMRLEPRRLLPPDDQRTDRPIYEVRGLPAGRYRVQFDAAGARGRVAIGVGVDRFAIQTAALDRETALTLDFPVDVRAIVVRGDRDANRTLRGMSVTPLAIVPGHEKPAPGTAQHAVRYGDATWFFMDGRGYPEPDAFWVGGAARAVILCRADTQVTSAVLFLRNAPVPNTLEIEAGGWRRELTLAPGEQRRVEVPLDAAADGKGRTTLLRFATRSGFRPSERDPDSADHRFLGVWVQPRPAAPVVSRAAQNRTTPPK